MHWPLGAWSLHPHDDRDGVGGPLVAGGGVASSGAVASG